MALENEYMLEELTAEEIYQKKLTAGTNITINPITNVISASGGGSSVSYSSNYDSGDVLGTLIINGTPTPVRTPNLVAGDNITITQSAQTGALTITADGGGDLVAHEITEEAYEALTPAQKQNGELYLTHPATVGSNEPNKIYYNATLYGTEGGNDVVELTQDEWDALPSSKLTDGIIYVITDGGGGGASAISDLTDVELTDLADGEILKYDATAEKWINSVESGGGTDNHAVHVPPVIYDNRDLKVVNDIYGFPGVEKIYLTQTEYDELSEAEKQDLTKIYYVSTYTYYNGNDGTAILRIKDNEILLFLKEYADEYLDASLHSKILEARNVSGTYVYGSIGCDSKFRLVPWIEGADDCQYVLVNGNNRRISLCDESMSKRPSISSGCLYPPIYATIDLSVGANQLQIPSINPQRNDPYNVTGGVAIYYGGKQYTTLELPTGLPDVTSEDNGDILKVVSGEWAKANAPREVPVIGLGDNEKVLTVESGEATWSSPKKVTHLYDEIPISNPLYFLGNIDPSTSPLTIDMTQFAANYEELRSTDFEFVFMGGESNLINRPWGYNPIDSAPGTFSYNPTTGELTATLYGGFNSVTSIGIVYKKAIIQLNENAVITGQSGTIDCSDIPNADVLIVDNFAIVLTNVNEPNTSNSGTLQIAASMSYNQTTKQLSWSVNAASFEHLTASGYVIVGNYGDPEYRLITNFTGATSSSDGYRGYVPTPLAGDENKVLKGDGTWGENANRLILDAQIYSEDERQVGVWTDGKPLYQRTLVREGNYGGQTTITFSEITSDMNVVYGYGYHIMTSGGVSYQYQINETGINSVYPQAGYQDRYYFNLSSESVSTKIFLTILYTKTTDSAGSGGYQAYGFSPVIYSEEEREVGVWVDNKPLYQKSYPIAGTPIVINNSGINIASYIDNFSDMETIVDGLSNCSDIQMAKSGSRIWVGYTNRNALMAYCAEATSANEITIWYTKTSDTAGSGSYNTLGVPNVHYKDDWHVVGTWWNGKPIYEKTFHFTTANLPADRETIEKIYDFDELVSIEGAFGYQHYAQDRRTYILGEAPPQLSNTAIYLLCEGNDSVNDIQDLNFNFSGLDRSKIVYISATVRITKTTD